MLHFSKLKLAVFWCSRKWNNVTNISHTGYKKHQPFEAKAKSGMRTAAKPPGIEIPFHLLFRDIHFIHSALKHFEPFLTLGPADDFTDLGEKDIHGSYSLSVVVQTHVERFDLFGIVGQDNRFFKLLFNEVTLVFTLEIKSVSTDRIL